MKSMNESSIRSRAMTQGFRICKSRKRSTDMDNYGNYMLVQIWNNTVVLGDKFDATLEQIAEFLEDESEVAA